MCNQAQIVAEKGERKAMRARNRHEQTGTHAAPITGYIVSGLHIVWNTGHASNQESRQSENPFSLTERNQMKARLALMIAIALSLSACIGPPDEPRVGTMMQASTLQANA
jgi:hypothetical protein